MEFKSASLHELNQVIGLSVETFKPNMKEQFRLLFSEDNLEHMLIAKDGNQVVSEVNYYPSTIQIPHASIRVASIGSVCTDIHYRGQGLASKLLQLAEQKMMEESISLAIISGDLGIYERFGAKDVGHMHQFVAYANHTESSKEYGYRLFEKRDLKWMFETYLKEEVRFDRTFHEFETLLLGQTYPDTYCKYPIYIITKNNQRVAYVILSVYVEDPFMKIKEYAGNRHACISLIQTFLKMHQKSSITWVSTPLDPIHRVSPLYSFKPITQRATLKMIHLGRFFSSIEPYILQYDHLFRILESSESEIKLHAKGHVIILNRDQALTMVFNGKTHLRKKVVLNWVKTCFPLPMPWTHNLNYQ